MAIHVTQIGKNKFVCGLFWQSLSRPRELKKEAADLAKKIDFDLMVLRTDHSTAQAGFAQSKDGARRSMLSLGAAVAKTLAMVGAYYDGEQQRAHNWLGAFKLPDGMWAYFAVRDANFLPNGDYAGSKEEVLERLLGDYGLGGWNVVVGDPELEAYGFHNFNAKRIEELLPEAKNGQVRIHKWWELRPVNKQIPWKRVAAVFSLTSMAAVGGTAYWHKYQQKKAEDELNRTIEEARKKMGAEQLGPRHPWMDMPVPSATLSKCVERFSHIAPGGWQLEEYACTSDSLNYSWSRQESTVEFLLAQVPDAVIDASGEKATYAEQLTLEKGGDDVLMEQKKLMEQVVSRLQLLKLSPKITKAAPVIATAVQTLPGTRAMSDGAWQAFSFVINTGSVFPTEIAGILGQPGMRINKLVYRGGTWSIEGVMYAK
ncbi:pilus assembly protein [Herbaspirillum sp. HC18]|nr:pilus assembly protein [Herbaspirillum sp. HC18]